MHRRFPSSLASRCCSVLLLLLVASAASAQTVPFTEHYDTDEAGWTENIGFPLNWVATGGPDGGSYASGEFDFMGFVEPFPGAGPIVFRGQDENMASNGNFEGDWNTAGVAFLSVWVRHDAPIDLEWIARIANTFNFPAAAFELVDPVVPPNTWTQLTFQVDKDAPLCTPESTNPMFTCENALANVAHLQFGTNAPQQLIDDEVIVTFDIDQPTIVPEPGLAATWATGLLGLIAIARHRARRQRRQED